MSKYLRYICDVMLEMSLLHMHAMKANTSLCIDQGLEFEQADQCLHSTLNT